MSTVATRVPARSPDAALDPLESRVIDHVFELQPGYAVWLGLHQYDGRLPDLTAPATDRWIAGADKLLAELAAFSREKLSPGRRLDATLLQLLLEGPLFDLREGRDLERNPMAYVGSLSLTSYMVRDYAPVAQRVDAMIRSVAGIPTVLDAGRQRLEPVVPEPFLRLAIAIGTGLSSHLAEAEAFASRGSPALAERFHAVRMPAETAIAQFLTFLKDDLAPRATPEFALGAARYQRLLWVREGITTPLSEMLAAGRADLERNQLRLAELAAIDRPSMPTAPALDEMFERLFRQHATAEGLVPRARELVEEVRGFTVAKGLATIPEPAVCRVEETPVYGRALSTASMNPPGPFDVSGDVGIYYITPVDPAWPAERREEWLRSLNDAMLRNITAHEVYPGHYLQFLHFRRSGGSFARKVFLSSAFSEGWAHYCEQLMIEAGLGSGSHDAEAAQLHDALLRDCRLIASIGLHTQGWTLAQATELFEREAHFERLPAEREAMRGTFNPEYFCYTLGKLAILDLRAKYLGSKFGGSLKAFHDELLGYGSPPVGMLDALMRPAA